MKFTVNARDFRDALRGCEKAVSKDQTREVLMYAHLVVTHDFVTLTALDGFQMVQYKLAAKNTEYSALQAEALIPPKLALTTLRDLKKEAVVEITDDGWMRVVTDFAVSVALPRVEGTYPDCETLWPNPKREQYRIAVNATYLAQIALACAGATDSRNHMVYLEVSANPVHPIIISSNSERCDARGLVLPIRVHA